MANHIRAIVYGPPGHLKTASSVTMSEKCPADWTHLRLTTPPQREEVALDDMLWIGFDSQALLGFKQLKVTAPIIDLSTATLATLSAELKATPTLVADRVAKGLTKTVVVDTVSALDTMVNVGHADAGLEKFDLFREVLFSHQRFQAALKKIPCNILFLCHSKAVFEVGGTSESSMKQAENQAKKVQATGTGSIIPSITGQGLELYRRDVSLIFSVSKGIRLEDDGAGKKVQKDGFWFHPRHKEFDTKARLILPDILPADWRTVKQFLTT